MVYGIYECNYVVIGYQLSHEKMTAGWVGGWVGGEKARRTRKIVSLSVVSA